MRAVIHGHRGGNDAPTNVNVRIELVSQLREPAQCLSEVTQCVFVLCSIVGVNPGDNDAVPDFVADSLFDTDEIRVLIVLKSSRSDRLAEPPSGISNSTVIRGFGRVSVVICLPQDSNV